MEMESKNYVVIMFGNYIRITPENYFRLMLGSYLIKP